MKPAIERMISWLIILCGIAFFVLVVLMVLQSEWPKTSAETRREAEQSLGAGAVCGKPDDGQLSCVWQGRYYRCAANSYHVACALDGNTVLPAEMK